MSCCRESANIWRYIKHPFQLRRSIFKNSHFWHDSFGVYWNRIIGCKTIRGHKNIQNIAEPNEEKEMYCFACQRKV